MSQPSHYGHQLQEYYVARVRKIMTTRRERIAKLKTSADAEKYVRTIRAAVRHSFGSLPRRTPLQLRVTGSEDHGAFRLEKIIYESRPGFLVTANLYLPPEDRKKHPATLGLCGHIAEGKAYPQYQAFAQGLARRGFVTLIIDPISQGERRQFYPHDGGTRPNTCAAHNLMGNPQRLFGDFFGKWRVWDALRGVDVLCARKDVDCRHLGVTGNSGGGTLTSFVTALEPRITMAAPSCYITSFLANLENELPCDSEQYPPGILASGLDHIDLLLAYAPRPTVILAERHDFFDERATATAYTELQKIHRLLGSRTSTAYHVGSGGHSYDQTAREAMYEFFCRQVGSSTAKISPREGKQKEFTPAELFATTPGEMRPGESRRVFEFSAETAANISKARGKPTAQNVKRHARRLLNLPVCKDAPHYRKISGYGNFPVGRWYGFRFAVETEPGIQAILTEYRVESTIHRRIPSGRVTLFVGHESSGEDVLKIPRVSRLITKRQPFFTLDPRGIGEAAARLCTNDPFAATYGSDYMYAGHGDMLGESYLGRRVFDTLRTLDCLQAHGVTKIDLIGRGLGAITVSFAALLHASNPRVRILNYLPSYELLTQTPLACWPLSALLSGVLEHFDLPDVYRILGKRLTKESPWDGRMRPLRKVISKKR